MDKKLKELLDRAREGGASAEQLREIIRTYKSNNATSPKGEVAEGENGGLESSSADTASSSEYNLPEINQEEVDNFIKEREHSLSMLPNLNNDKKTFKDSSGKIHMYDPKKQTVHTDPRTGKATIVDAPYQDIKETLSKQIIEKSGIDINDIKNLGDDNKTRRLIKETEDFVEAYVKRTGEGENPLKLATDMAAFNEEFGMQSSDDIIKMSGINIDNIAKDFKEKIEEESDNMSFYKYNYSDRTGVMDSYGDRDKTRKDVKTTQNIYKRDLEYDYTEPLIEYGFDVNDFNGFLEESGNKRLKELYKKGILSNVKPAEKEYQQYKMLASYTKDRLNYLTGYKKNLDYKKRRGVDVSNDEYLKVDNEINNIQQGLSNYVKNELPNFKKTLEEKKQKTIDSYKEYKNGEKNWYHGVGRWLKGTYIGVENGLADIGVFASDVIGADNFAEEWRVSRNLDDLVESNDLMYSYASGKKVSNEDGNFLVKEDGSIIDLDTKKNITSIASDLGINTEKIIEQSKNGEEDYSFSLGNTSELSGEVIGNLAIQLVGTKGVMGVVGTSTKAASLSGMLVAGGMSYTSTYEDTLQMLRDNGVSDKEATQQASDVASVVSFTVAATSSIAYNPNALKLISKSPKFKQAALEAIKMEKEVGKKQAAKYLMGKTIKFIGGGFKEGIEESIQENLENLAQTYANAQTNKDLGKKILDQNISKDEVIETSIMAFAPSFILGGAGNIKGSVNSDKKELYDIMSSDISKLENVLSTMVEDGYTSKDKADKLKKDVEKYLKYSNKVPKETTTEQLFNVIDLLDERNKLINRKQNEDPAFHSKINEEIVLVDEKINKVYDKNKTATTESKPDENLDKTKTETKQGESKTESEEKVGIEIIDTGKGSESKEVNRTNDVEVVGSPKNTMINVGMKKGQTNEDISEQKIKDALPEGVEVLNSGIKTVESEGGTENTLSLELSRPLTDSEMNQYLQDTGQMAIPQISDGKGAMYGTKDWGDFNPEYFSTPDGKMLNEIINESNKKSTEVQATTEGARTNETGTDKSVDENVQTSISQIEKIDLSDKLGVNKVKDILDKLDYDLKKFGDETLGINLPVAVARGAIKAMKSAVGTAKTGLDITSAGLNYVQNTKWYKGLNKADKDEFHKTGIVGKLNEVETELRKGYNTKDPSVKKTIREKTGQVDMSRKRLISEAKLLKDHFKALSKGAKEGSKHMEKLKNNFVDQIRKITKGLGEDMKSSEVDQLINKVKKFNGKNTNEIKKEVKNILERVEKRKEKLKYNSTLKNIVKKAIKVQKKKIGHIGQNILELSRIRPESIPEEHIENYYNVMEAVSKNKYVKEDVDALYADLKEAIIKDVEARNEEREVNRSKDPKDTSELIVEAKKAISKVYDTSLLYDSEIDILKRLKKIPFNKIKELNAKKLNEIINDLEQLGEYGVLNNKRISSIVNILETVDVVNEIETKVGANTLRVSSGLYQEIKRIFGKKEQSVDEMVERFQNTMLHHYDRLIKGVKGTIFYKDIIHPVTAGLQAASENAIRYGRELEILQKAAKLKGKEFDFNVKLELLFRELEYQSNLAFAGKKVFKTSDHIKATQELFDKGKSQYSEEDVNTINEIYNKYKNEDGEIDVDKLENSFSPAEMKIVKFMRDKLSESANKRREIDSDLLGESSLLLENYFTRNYDKGVKRRRKLKDVFTKPNSASVKANSGKSRDVNSAQALNFNTMSNFLSHLKEIELEYNTSKVIKKSGAILSQLQESGNKDLVKVAMAIEESINTLVDLQTNKNMFATKTKTERFVQILLKNTFNKVLISIPRLTTDLITNNVPLLLFNIDRLPSILKARKNMMGISKDIMKDYSSTQRDRIGGSRAIDFQEGMSSSLGKAKWNQKNVSKFDKVLDLLSKNKLSDLGDLAAVRYYQAVDFSAKIFFDFYFMENFEKITGEKFNPTEYKNNKEYKLKHDRALANTVAETDKQISNLYNTGAQSEQKLNAQLGSYNKNILSRIKNYMQSFAFNENSVWWDSLMSIMGKEGGTMDSKKEALRTFALVNARSIGYSYFSMTLFESIMSAFEWVEDDEELEEKAMKRALGQHGMLIAFGNKGALFNMGAAFLFENYIHKNVVKSQGGKYNGYEDSILYAPTNFSSLKSHIGSFGAEGQFLQTVIDGGDLASNLLMEYADKGTISKDKWIEYKALKITASALSQLTGLPINKLGSNMQKSLDYELKKKKEAVKKKEKKKKSKKSAFAF